MLKTVCDGSGHGVVICHDKNTLDKQKALRTLTKSLHSNIYAGGREWPYKNVQNKIIAEEYIEDKNGELLDYKIWNFNGEPKLIQVDYDRFAGTHHRQLFTPTWQRIYKDIEYKADENRTFSPPPALDQMLALAKQLSQGHPFLRTDFYNVDGKIYVGELTFFPGCGFEKCDPPKFDYELGQLLTLPAKQ